MYVFFVFFLSFLVGENDVRVRVHFYRFFFLLHFAFKTDFFSAYFFFSSFWVINFLFELITWFSFIFFSPFSSLLSINPCSLLYNTSPYSTFFFCFYILLFTSRSDLTSLFYPFQSSLPPSSLSLFFPSLFSLSLLSLPLLSFPLIGMHSNPPSCPCPPSCPRPSPILSPSLSFALTLVFPILPPLFTLSIFFLCSLFYHIALFSRGVLWLYSPLFSLLPLLFTFCSSYFSLSISLSLYTNFRVPSLPDSLSSFSVSLSFRLCLSFSVALCFSLQWFALCSAVLSPLFVLRSLCRHYPHCVSSPRGPGLLCSLILPSHPCLLCFLPLLFLVRVICRCCVLFFQICVNLWEASLIVDVIDVDVRLQ